ncbi:Flavodoxin reductases (ferredoxin-NADPH reductases) family 1 / Vanillate O-demethylase oxidoreductase (EC [Amycolatopsis camponoti]|uniref:Flavodoxin reductases (Ferredoxin-NADPH reductases) family 1 / Vanillate O-demethylase oxidoreductase (EC) n=1 Tax=Amycolatopsis camponoti TaxID=2606593 RepID=A0A6I8LTI1_9PSEU|nr:PDR/VanB family oxidoreductase [Amycolatopsis camponoti]VVJ21294.1 Flavodoxin reductases (ferredoxin-NADPH reductases) family 1 / Vanillate O-demethylase oxidoreductase (EC [Amycolatopsis camponoti]
MQKTMLESVEHVADDVVSLVLRGDEGPLEAWEPGAHIDLALPNWLTRQYSLCGDPGDLSAYRIAVRLDPLSRGGSEYIHWYLSPGRTLEVSSPRNHFPLVPAPEYLFLAGGIGITPIVPMLRAAVAAGAAASLVYVGRSASTMPFAAELVATYGERVSLFSHDRPDLASFAEFAGEVYCCGPASMLAAAEAVFPRVHAERFEPTRRVFGPDTPFEVVCARSGSTIQVPADESLLDALNHAGKPVPSGCREGVCGSCELSVLDGEPEHRDDIGAPAGRMYACVSRASSPRLVLDV